MSTNSRLSNPEHWNKIFKLYNNMCDKLVYKNNQLEDELKATKMKLFETEWQLNNLRKLKTVNDMNYQQLYEGALEDIKRLTNERDTLSKENTVLLEELEQERTAHTENLKDARAEIARLTNGELKQISIPDEVIDMPEITTTEDLDLENNPDYQHALAFELGGEG